MAKKMQTFKFDETLIRDLKRAAEHFKLPFNRHVETVLKEDVEVFKQKQRVIKKIKTWVK